MPAPITAFPAVHRAHLLNVNYIYELPFFHRSSNRHVRNVLGGWEVAGVTTYQSGAPNSLTVHIRRGAHRRQFVARHPGRESEPARPVSGRWRAGSTRKRRWRRRRWCRASSATAGATC